MDTMEAAQQLHLGDTVGHLRPIAQSQVALQQCQPPDWAPSVQGA